MRNHRPFISPLHILAPCSGLWDSHSDCRRFLVTPPRCSSGQMELVTHVGASPQVASGLQYSSPGGAQCVFDSGARGQVLEDRHLGSYQRATPCVGLTQMWCWPDDLVLLPLQELSILMQLIVLTSGTCMAWSGPLDTSHSVLMGTNFTGMNFTGSPHIFCLTECKGSQPDRPQIDSVGPFTAY